MTSHHVHKIRRQHLHVALNGDETDGFALQNRLSALCRDWLAPALEQALDRCAPAEDILHIEHLEVDAGEVNLDRLEQDVVAQIVRSIEAVLLEKKHQAGYRGDQSAAPSAAEDAMKTEAQACWEAFVYFLESGRFPWLFRLADRESLEAKIRALWLEGKRGTSVLREKQEVLRETWKLPAVRRRFVNQFSEAFISAWLGSISPAGLEKVRDALSLFRVVLPGSEVVFWEKRMWEIALLMATGAGIPARHPESAPDFFNALLSDVFQHTIREAPRQTEALREILLRAKPSDAAKKLLALLPVSTDSLPAPVEIDQSPSADEVEGIYVDQAGVVLLHPFLPQFFNALNIVEDDLLVQPDRALQLLHYLGTGQAEAPEYELSLAKVLCGLPLDYPAEIPEPLTEAEMAEADNLLESVVRHWNALKNTSPDALREAFLRRPGKLSRRVEGDWWLQMETRSHDILLDRLPWGIGMVQLPWMKEMLHVEWGT